MDNDEHITVEYLKNYYIDAQYNRIVKAVLENCANGHVNFAAEVNVTSHESILELLRKKFPDCKILIEPSTPHPGLIFYDQTFSKRIAPPKKCKIVIDWSGAI
jgi:hypothetical protein